MSANSNKKTNRSRAGDGPQRHFQFYRKTEVNNNLIYLILDVFYT